MTNDISLNSMEALIAAVPALLGFTPSDSIVVLVLGTTSPPLRLTIRLDMPAPNNTAAVVSKLRTILAQHSADGIITGARRRHRDTSNCRDDGRPCGGRLTRHGRGERPSFVAASGVRGRASSDDPAPRRRGAHGVG
jgi:hypothetical protein